MTKEIEGPGLINDPRRPAGVCGYVPDIRADALAPCDETARYVLTSSKNHRKFDACLRHTAWARAIHPDWIESVEDYRSAGAA